ncbi:hypothetical protein TGMAS_237270 [Toxoplasma gondii MAS]|uniref:Uncharacterized protein n=1 Tax=Toxoplasma gondii MAS TaxID=943118 RepID=A0A086QUN4_TOXGO|nr:hypothetical protein TGMAS_237270 [Toxoplasma gondii MAS]
MRHVLEISTLSRFERSRVLVVLTFLRSLHHSRISPSHWERCARLKSRRKILMALKLLGPYMATHKTKRTVDLREPTRSGCWGTSPGVGMFLHRAGRPKFFVAAGHRQASGEVLKAARHVCLSRSRSTDILTAHPCHLEGKSASSTLSLLQDERVCSPSSRNARKGNSIRVQLQRRELVPLDLDAMWGLSDLMLLN